MTKEQIIEQTNAFFIEKLGFDKESISPDADLKRDLGMTSLDAINIVLYIRHTYGIQPQIPDMKAIITMQDLYDCIEQYLQSK